MHDLLSPVIHYVSYLFALVTDQTHSHVGLLSLQSVQRKAKTESATKSTTLACALLGMDEGGAGEGRKDLGRTKKYVMSFAAYMDLHT